MYISSTQHNIHVRRPLPIQHDILLRFHTCYKVYKSEYIIKFFELKAEQSKAKQEQ